MFERFTDRARRVVVLAQEEARMLNHNYIGTEHILLGLIHEGEGVAAKALESLGIDFEVMEYSQQSRSAGDDAEAACYIAADVNQSKVWGAGIAGSTTRASINAINSAVNRALA